MKKDQNVKKPYIKTRTRSNGGVEVEITKSPAKTLLGKIFAIAIAFITVFGSVLGLIYLLILEFGK